MASSTASPAEKSHSKPESMNAVARIPVMASSLFVQIQAPFTPQQFFKPNSNFLAVAPPEFLHNFHKTIASKADECLKFLQISAAQNPFFKKLLSLSSHFHNFSQVHCRSFRTMNSVSSHNFAAVLPGDSVAGVVVTNGILNFLNIYNTLLVVRLVLTWFPNTPPQIVSPLSTLCDPYLNIFRGIIPPLGGALDLSPILAFLVLNAFTSAAAALPAELPATGVSHEASSMPTMSELTSSQRKWRTRLQNNSSSNNNDPN